MKGNSALICGRECMSDYSISPIANLVYNKTSASQRPQTTKSRGTDNDGGPNFAVILTGLAISLINPAVGIPIALGGLMLACGTERPEGDGDFKEEARGGIPGQQPDPEAYPDETTAVAGADNDPADDPTCIDTNNNGIFNDLTDTCILNKDQNGNSILSDEAFAANTGINYLDGTHILPFVWNFEGYYGNVNWNDYQIVIATDSTRLPNMPADAAPQPGLVAANQATQANIDNGFACQEAGYTTFLACPTYPENQLPLYLAGYAIEARDENDRLIGQAAVSNIETSEAGLNAFFADPGAYAGFLVPRS